MTNKNNNFAVIMAGGIGSRFWPLSTSDFPKQFHDILGTGRTLIQHTFDRLAGLIPHDQILVLTNERYLDLVLEQLPEITADQVVLEPEMRNTAPCILYASLKIQKMNPDAKIIVASSDHWIEDNASFEDNVKEAFSFCDNHRGALITLGIQPTFPNTGYGYIEYEKGSVQTVNKVVQFLEKPDYQTAKSFLDQNNFLWNAGIFLWHVNGVLSAYKSYQPEMFDLFRKGEEVYNTVHERAFIADNYPKAEDISVDFAIMEKSPSVYVTRAKFDWNDLGTWGSLYDRMNKDSQENAVINARVLMESSEGNLVRTDNNKIVVVNGLKDYIIVDRKDVLLIYPKSKEQDIKQVMKSCQTKFN